MTYEEAIRELQLLHKLFVKLPTGKNVCKALDLAINALTYLQQHEEK